MIKDYKYLVALIALPCSLYGTSPLVNNLLNRAKLIQDIKTQFIPAPNLPYNNDLMGATARYLSDENRRQKIIDTFNTSRGPGLTGNIELETLAAKVMQREQMHVDDYYVFYHGQMFEFRVLQDTIEILTQLLNLKARLKHFFYLRGPENTNYPIISAQDYIELLNNKHGRWTDHIPDIQKILVSVNLSLFGNTEYAYLGECSFYFFIHSSNVFAPFLGFMLETFFKEHGFSDIHTQKLVDIAYKYKSKEGILLQIFIPKKIVDECAYLCHAGGVPYNTRLISEGWDEQKQRYTRIAPILDAYQNNPALLGTIDHLQARLVMTSDTFLNPDSGIKMYRYGSLTKEAKRKYKAEIRAVLDQVILDALSQKQIEQSPYPLAKLFNLVKNATTQKPDVAKNNGKARDVAPIRKKIVPAKGALKKAKRK